MTAALGTKHHAWPVPRSRDPVRCVHCGEAIVPDALAYRGWRHVSAPRPASRPARDLTRVLGTRGEPDRGLTEAPGSVSTAAAAGPPTQAAATPPR
jgi:hypothetical protein